MGARTRILNKVSTILQIIGSVRHILLLKLCWWVGKMRCSTWDLKCAVYIAFIFFCIVMIVGFNLYIVIKTDRHYIVCSTKLVRWIVNSVINFTVFNLWQICLGSAFPLRFSLSKMCVKGNMITMYYDPCSYCAEMSLDQQSANPKSLLQVSDSTITRLLLHLIKSTPVQCTMKTTFLQLVINWMYLKNERHHEGRAWWCLTYCR